MTCRLLADDDGRSHRNTKGNFGNDGEMSWI